MYDPKVGRWLSEDPIGFNGRDSNVLRYGGNSPTTLKDPSGLDSISISDEEIRVVYWEPGHRPIGFMRGTQAVQILAAYGGGEVRLQDLRAFASRNNFESMLQKYNSSYVSGDLFADMIKRHLPREDWSRTYREDRWSMRYFASDFLHYEIGPTPLDRGPYRMGCIGLAMLRLGFDPQKYYKFREILVTGSIGFYNKLDARRAQARLGPDKYNLVAVQLPVPIRAWEDGDGYKDDSVRFDPARIDITNPFNFATWLGGSSCWEWANHGLSISNSPPEVAHSLFLPIDSYDYTYYVLIPTGSSPSGR